MSKVPGEFLETTLLDQRYMADKMMLDSRIKQQFIPKFNAFNYIKSLQTATVNTAFNTKAKKDYDVEIMWMNACDTFDIEDVSCAIGGEELSTNTETYKLHQRFVKGFTVKDDAFRSNEYETNEAIAKGLLRIDKELTENFTQYLVGLLNTYSGVNQVTNGGAGIVVNGNITEIAPALWIPNIMAYFARVAIMNRFDSHALISGANMWESLYVANAMKANSDGKGDYILWNDIPIWFDLFNIDGVNDPDYFTYMVSQGALAIANKAFNPDSPYKNFHDIRYTLPSRFMSGIKYDVFYNNECKEDNGGRQVSGTNNSDTLWHNYKVVLTADMFLNPEGCEEDNTGVLRFENV